MSHVAMLDVIVNDIDALEKACQECGLELVRGKSDWLWWGRWVADYHASDAAYKNGIDPSTYGKNALHVIRVPGNTEAYEIGVYANPKGEGYVLCYDFYGSQGAAISKKVGGQQCYALVDSYSKHAAIKVAQNMGMQVSEQVEEDGTIVLTMFDYSN